MDELAYLTRERGYTHTRARTDKTAAAVTAAAAAVTVTIGSDVDTKKQLCTSNDMLLERGVRGGVGRENFRVAVIERKSDTRR